MSAKDNEESISTIRREQKLGLQSFATRLIQKNVMLKYRNKFAHASDEHQLLID